MIFSYFQGLNWPLMQSQIWTGLIQACALSMDAVLPDIGTTRDLYLPWVSPDAHASSRGMVQLPYEATDAYYQRIRSAYTFWKKIHSPENIEIGKINEYTGDKWAEFNLEINQQKTLEEIETLLRFLLDIKPARSRLKGVLYMSDFLVTKEHTHTGDDDGAVLDHQQLHNCGSVTHDILETQLAAVMQTPPVFNAQAFLRIQALDNDPYTPTFQEAAVIVCAFQWNQDHYKDVICRPMVSFELIYDPNLTPPASVNPFDVDMRFIVNGVEESTETRTFTVMGGKEAYARPLRLEHGQRISLEMRSGHQKVYIQNIYFEILPVVIEDSDDNAGLSTPQRLKI